MALGGGAHPLDPSSLTQLGMDGRNVCVAYSGYVLGRGQCTRRIRSKVDSFVVSRKEGQRVLNVVSPWTEYLCGWLSFILCFPQSLVVLSDSLQFVVVHVGGVVCRFIIITF